MVVGGNEKATTPTSWIKDRCVGILNSQFNNKLDDFRGSIVLAEFIPLIGRNNFFIYLPDNVMIKLL
jgi:hypothetical protein